MRYAFWLRVRVRSRAEASEVSQRTVLFGFPPTTSLLKVPRLTGGSCSTSLPRPIGAPRRAPQKTRPHGEGSPARRRWYTRSNKASKANSALTRNKGALIDAPLPKADHGQTKDVATQGMSPPSLNSE